MNNDPQSAVVDSVTAAMSKLAGDLWQRDWVESNGGNVSWRLPQDTAYALAALPSGEPVKLALRFPDLANEVFCVTAAGSYLRNVPLQPQKTLGLVRLDETGSGYRLLWGFEGGGRPTSEFCAHLGAHSVLKGRLGDLGRVVVHTHPANAVALTHAGEFDSRSLTVALWRMHTECMMVFPEGLAYVPVRVPGSTELARDTAAAMQASNIAVWRHHGVFASGKDLDQAFGRVHVVEKAAEIYLKTLAACGGKIPATINDEELKAIAAVYGPGFRRDYLE